jgi:hypothetical protein
LFSADPNSLPLSSCKLWAWQCSELTKILRAYSENLAQYSIASLSETLHIAAKNVITRLLEAKLKANPILGPLKLALTEAKDEFIDFRTAHKLRRPARDNERKFTTLGLLVFLIAIESVSNGVFFSKGSDHGLLGGVVCNRHFIL